MRIIEADIHPSAPREPAFDTPEAAISWGGSRDAQLDARVQSLYGRTISEARWNDSTLALQIDHELWRIHGSARGLAILPTDNDQWPALDSSANPVEVRLSEIVFVWDRAQLARRMVGNQLHRISGGPAMLFIDVANFGILAVSTLIDRQSGDVLLLWIEGN